MTTEVKNFNSSMPGAPVDNGTAGALVALLDACLKDGFGLQTVSSLVVSGGVATATVPATPSAQVDSIVVVSGATPAGLNGEKRVIAATANGVSFATTEADGSASGTISLKLAPLGWLKSYIGTNKAAYKPSAPEASGCLLRVDDTGTTTARVRGFESMSDIDTGLGLFPTDALMSGGAYWPKSSTADATARPWFLFGDARGLWLYLAPGASATTQGVVFGFGDIASHKSGDAYGCVLLGGASGVQAATSRIEGCAGHGREATRYAWLARSWTGIGGAVAAKKLGALNTGAGYSGEAAYNSDTLAYPNGPDNGLTVTPIELAESTALRGTLPGLLHCPLQVASAFQTGDVVDGTGAYAGRKLRALRVGTTGNTSAAGVLFVDQTGPWR